MSLEQAIRYDVEHDLFHPQNIFSDEYITPTFVEYVRKLEAQIEKMKCCANCKSFRGYGETCEGWGEPVLNLNCDCTEWELKE